MKRIFFICVLVLGIFSLIYADMPGNKPRPSVYVHVIATDSVSQYRFFYRGSYDEADSTLNDTIWLRGGMGRPDEVSIWGVHKKTNQSTDSIYFENQSDNITATIRNVVDGKIQYEEAFSPADSDYTETEEQKNEAPEQLPKKANLLLYLSGVALVFLVFYLFNQNRKRK